MDDESEVLRILARLDKKVSIRYWQTPCRICIGISLFKVLLGIDPIASAAIGLVFFVTDALLNRLADQIRDEAMAFALRELTVMPFNLEWEKEESLLGDPTCRYSAHSELLRCAINPTGPCSGCAVFEER